MQAFQLDHVFVLLAITLVIMQMAAPNAKEEQEYLVIVHFLIVSHVAIVFGRALLSKM